MTDFIDSYLDAQPRLPWQIVTHGCMERAFVTATRLLALQQERPGILHNVRTIWLRPRTGDQLIANSLSGPIEWRLHAAAAFRHKDQHYVADRSLHLHSVPFEEYCMGFENAEVGDCPLTLVGMSAPIVLVSGPDGEASMVFRPDVRNRLHEECHMPSQPTLAEAAAAVTTILNNDSYALAGLKL